MGRRGGTGVWWGKEEEEEEGGERSPIPTHKGMRERGHAIYIGHEDICVEPRPLSRSLATAAADSWVGGWGRWVGKGGGVDGWERETCGMSVG